MRCGYVDDSDDFIDGSNEMKREYDMGEIRIFINADGTCPECGASGEKWIEGR